MPTDEQSAALFAAKLKALTRDRVGASARPGSLPGGAAVVDGDAVWVLLAPERADRLGSALAWARRQGTREVHVLVDDAEVAGALARRAALFRAPAHVWRVEGTSLVAAVPAPPPPLAPPPVAPELEDVLRAEGLEVVPGDGVLLGELLGLEVARIVEGSEGPELSVGVGRFDREIAEMTQAHLSPAERVARVVEIVAQYRAPGAAPHPLNQLVPERWLRSALVDDPALVGAATLAAVPSVGERATLLASGVASALGTDTEGRPLMVTCSTGVDLELAPLAADDRALHAPGARLVLAVPERDAVALTRDLASDLDPPAEVLGVGGEWRIPWQR